MVTHAPCTGATLATLASAAGSSSADLGVDGGENPKEPSSLGDDLGDTAGSLREEGKKASSPLLGVEGEKASCGGVEGEKCLGVDAGE